MIYIKYNGRFKRENIQENRFKALLQLNNY